MATVTEDMVIDAVDQRDIPVGKILRKDVFQKHANFRVAHDLIFNSSGELLVQQLASTRTRHPNFWGASVAAYLFAGESYRVAAERRLSEELGVKGLQLNFVGKTTMVDGDCHKFIGVFSTTFDGPFNFDRSHIEKIEFLSRQKIHELQASRARAFTPTFLHVLGFYESRM